MTKRIGIFTDISFEEYCAIEAVNSSSFNEFARSPAHYYDKYLSPSREPESPTAPMQFGTAIHTAVLESEKFEKIYAIKPTPEDFPSALVSLDDYKAKCRELELKTSGTKAELKQRILEINLAAQFFDDIEVAVTMNYKVLSKDQWHACRAIAARIRGSATATTLFENGMTEVTLLWIDPLTDLYCKARLDYFVNLDEARFVVDFKSTEDARPEAFQKSIELYGYHRQGAHYLNGVKVLTGKQCDLFYFAAYEKSSPFAASFPFIGEDMLAMGRREVDYVLRNIKRCKDAEIWPAYDEMPKPVGLSKFYKSIIREETF